MAPPSLSAIVNRIELVRLPFKACAWHGRGINGRDLIRSPGGTSAGVMCDRTRDLPTAAAACVIILSTEHAAFQQIEADRIKVGWGRRFEVLVFAAFSNFVWQVRRGESKQ